jgi:hypothetical protein
MMVERRIARAAERFWELVGGRPAPPADIERAIPWALPLDIRRVNGLSVDGIVAWLRARGLPHPPLGPTRRLRGCLLARRGQGVVFVAADDPPEEQRFTLAHETAHFLLDYQEKRARALARLGEAIRPVLDGDRPPTPDERVHALLADVPLGLHAHLMERGPDGALCLEVADTERDADRLALELLAPEEQALALLRATRGETYTARVARAADAMAVRFGLPAAVAETYARRLLRRATGGPSVAEWLGMGAGR